MTLFESFVDKFMRDEYEKRHVNCRCTWNGNPTYKDGHGMETLCINTLKNKELLYDKALKASRECKGIYPTSKYLEKIREEMKMEPHTLDMRVDRVIYNDPATIIFWKDGSKTVVKCAEGEKFSKYNGLTAAIAKRLYGGNAYIKRMVQEGYDEVAKKKAQREAKIEKLDKKSQKSSFCCNKFDKKAESYKPNSVKDVASSWDIWENFYSEMVKKLTNVFPGSITNSNNASEDKKND